MLISILKSTFRTLRRNSIYATINIAGLSMSFACAIVIALIVKYETSYDNHLSDGENIFRVNTVWDGSRFLATSPPPLSDVIREELPEVLATTRLYRRGDFTLRSDRNNSQAFRETNIYLADQDYFNVFRDMLLAGAPKTALSNPQSIVLTESMARKYFGEDIDYTQLLERELLGGKDGGTHWKITGVMKDVPQNSHQDFDALVSSITNKFFHENNGWTWNSVYTYVRVTGTMDSKTTEEKFAGIVTLHVLPYMGYTSEEYAKSGSTFEFKLQPIRSIHLHSSYLREIKSNGDIAIVRMLIGVGILLILIGGANYINLATAQSIRHTREVGMRKVLGSGKFVLMARFLAESVLLSIISVIVALGLVELFMMYFAGDFGFKFEYSVFQNWQLTLVIAILGILIGLLSGAYPAFYLTSLSPSSALKGTHTEKLESVKFRNALIIIQFFISGGLIITTAVVNKQLNYIHGKSLGFEKENVIIIQNDREIDERRYEFTDALKALPVVDIAGFATGVPAQLDFKVRDISVENEDFNDGMRWYQSDDSYLLTLRMKLVEGRWFSRYIKSDTATVIVNEAAVDAMGLENPIGTRLTINKGENDEQNVTIVGVVHDFNSESFYHPVKPLVLGYLNDFIFKDYLAIKINSEDLPEAISQIKATWVEFEPDVPFNYSFLDENFEAMFKAEERMTLVFNIFSSIAVIVACLGLFGLATYTTLMRKKEIGIRKVLGSSASSVILLLSRSYSLLALVGFIISTPVAHIAMSKWLNQFVFRINMDIWIFIFSGVGLLFICLLTVTFQSLKAVYANPIYALKEE